MARHFDTDRLPRPGDGSTVPPMDWFPTALILLGGLVFLGAVLAMRTRRDRGAGTEGRAWETDDVREAQRRRDDPEVREWDAGGPH